MIEHEIAEIIERHFGNTWYDVQPSDKAKAAAREIFERYAVMLEARSKQALSTSHVVTPACDCGAQRVTPPAKHATWCTLINGSRRRF